MQGERARILGLQAHNGYADISGNEGENLNCKHEGGLFAITGFQARVSVMIVMVFVVAGLL